jgi:hypothetical protein
MIETDSALGTIYDNVHADDVSQLPLVLDVELRPGMGRETNH